MDYAKTNQGLTLIEILVVLGILALILAMTTVVNTDLFKGDIFRSEESTIVSLLQKARSRAMANMYDNTHGVCYDAVSDNYVLFRTTCNPSASTSERFPANVNISENSGTTSPFPTFIFDKLTGNTTGGTIHISDGVKATDIIINNEGTISW
jgi:prepilin-type N-terminal cleavage/methylation domain-containing protein